MSRNVFCLLGLPIDIVTMRETVDAVRVAVRAASPFHLDAQSELPDRVPDG